MPAIDPAALLASANCYNCYGSSGTIGLMTLGLLRQIALTLNPMADTSPQALLAQANCYRCYQGTEPLLMLALLAQIANNGGAGGTWTVWQDTGPNPSGPPSDPTVALTVRFRDGSLPVVWDPVNLVYR